MEGKPMSELANTNYASEVPKLKKSFIVKYNLTGLSLAASYALISYTTIYASDVMGLNLATVSLVLLLSKIFDGVTDIIAGWLIDRTHTRWGKARPYTLAIVGYWVCIALIFSAPKMSQTAGVIYLFVMYTIAVSGFNTLVSCADAPLMANTLEDPRQSVSLLGFGGVMNAVVGLVFGIAIPQFVAKAGNNPALWSRLAWFMAIPLALIGASRFFLIREIRDNTAGRQDTSIKSILKNLVKNKYLLLIGAMVLISYMGAQMMTAAGTFYYKYIFGDIGVGSIMALSLIPLIIFTGLMPTLVRKFTMKKVFMVVTLIGMVGCMIRLLNVHSVALGFVGLCMSSIAFQSFYGFCNSMILECMDYGEWKTGIRIEGSMASVSSFMNKIGTAVGAALPGFLIGLTGYNGALDVQSSATNTMIITVSTVIPCLFYVLFFILFRFYDLESKLPQIRQELAQRRGESSQPQAAAE